MEKVITHTKVIFKASVRTSPRINVHHMLRSRSWKEFRVLSEGEKTKIIRCQMHKCVTGEQLLPQPAPFLQDFLLPRFSSQSAHVMQDKGRWCWLWLRVSATCSGFYPCGAAVLPVMEGIQPSGGRAGTSWGCGFQFIWFCWFGFTAFIFGKYKTFCLL